MSSKPPIKRAIIKLCLPQILRYSFLTSAIDHGQEQERQR